MDGCCSRRVRHFALTHHVNHVLHCTVDFARFVLLACKHTDLRCAAGNGTLIEDFVQRSGTRFVVQSRNGSKGDCETFYFSGANSNYLVSFACPRGRYCRSHMSHHATCHQTTVPPQV